MDLSQENPRDGDGGDDDDDDNNDAVDTNG